MLIPRARARRLALLAGAWAALCLGGPAGTARAQGQSPPASAAGVAAPAQRPAPAAGAAGQAAGAPAKGPLVDESFSIQQDADLFQLQEAASLISRSLDKIADRVNTLAINSVYYGQGVPPDFRMKAEVIILQKLLDANANVKLVQCQECQKLETRIVNGVLRIRKGVPSVEARRELAKKLGVDGFIDIGLYREHNQMTIYLKVVEAQTGAIILVDEVVGRQAYKRDAVTLSFGEVNFPVVIGTKTVSHNTLALTANEQVQLTGRFSFGVDVTFYTDNNQNLAQPHLTLDGGILLGPYLGFDVVQLPQSTTRVTGYLGLGKLIDPQLNYGDLYRAGVEFIVGDRLVLVFGANAFSKTNIAVSNSQIAKQPALTGATLDGVEYELRFGYRF